MCLFRVKPYKIDEMARTLEKDSLNEKLIISTMAGVNLSQLQNIFLPGKPRIIRAIPSIACKLGVGIVTLYADANSPLGDQEKSRIENLFSKSGLTLWEENENLIDTYTAVGASTPAFYALFIDAIADATVLMGIPRDRAILLAAQSALGSATLILQEYGSGRKLIGTEACQVKNAVCTPGGCSIKGIHALEQGSVRGHIMNALEKSCLAFKR